MATACSLALSQQLGLYRNHQASKEFQSWTGSGRVHLLGAISSLSLRQDTWSIHLSDRLQRRVHAVPNRRKLFKCHSVLNPGHPFHVSSLKNAAVELMRSSSALQGKPVLLKLVPAVTILLFAVWGLGPLMRLSRNIFLHKSDNSWKKSSANYIMTSYLQPILLWTGATLICRALDPVVLPSEASEIVKQRLLNFVRSLSTVLAFAYCISSVIQQTQKYFMETKDPADTRNMGFQFAGKAVYTAVWVAAVSLFMELLGFSTQKWLTAGGLGTVLLTLAGREIFTNFLSSVMIHATRPFIVNEWIQTKIEGYEVSGTVEHVGWWSPTIIRGEDREAVHIPNHKFTVNVVRNLTQKSHWRIKTHLAISHLDVNKINNIVADMRKVLAKNPQVEQQKLHRRVFLENVNPENQALMILISCFVKTSHFEEYLCVKEGILLDLLRVISHHRARLATPIRTVQKIYGDADLDNMPFADSVFTRGRASANRPLLLIEPSYKVNGEDRTKSQIRRTTGEQDDKAATRTKPDNQVDVKGGPSDVKAREKQTLDSKEKETSLSDTKAKFSTGDMPTPDSKRDQKIAATSTLDTKLGDEVIDKTLLKSGIASQTTDNQVEVKGGPSDSKRKEKQTLDSNEAALSDTKAKSTTGDMPTPDSKKDQKIAVIPVHDTKPGDKVVDKTLSKPGAKAAEVLTSNSSAPLSDNKKRPKNKDLETTSQNTVVQNPASAVPETSGKKVSASTSNTKPTERFPDAQTPASRPVLEENIVLGVALDGSKRTLPIEEGMSPSATTPEVKELAASRGGVAFPATDKDNNHNSSAPGAAPADK